MDAPQLAIASGITQRFERNCRLDDVTVIGQCPLRLHNNVQAVILAVIRVAIFGVRLIGLHAEGIEVERVGAPLIVEGVDGWPCDTGCE